MGIFIYVSQKEIVLDVISELPDEVSLEQIAEKIEFLGQSKKGWTSSIVAKASRMKKSSDSSPHGLQADLVACGSRRSARHRSFYRPR